MKHIPIIIILLLSSHLFAQEYTIYNDNVIKVIPVVDSIIKQNINFDDSSGLYVTGDKNVECIVYISLYQDSMGKIQNVEIQITCPEGSTHKEFLSLSKNRIIQDILLLEAFDIFVDFDVFQMYTKQEFFKKYTYNVLRFPLKI